MFRFTQFIAKRKHNFVNNYIRKSSFTNDKLAPAYQPKNTENVELPANNNIVHPNLHIGAPKFSMLLPPPNVTGDLHLGHAFTCTIQDVIARFKRSKGFDVVWIPGMDHAGIATQVIVEKKIMAEMGKSRHDLGREQFLEEVWKWKKEKAISIENDLKKLGTTFDWDKAYFTLDETRSNAVIEAFVTLFDAGIIYRSESLVNWSCALESAISDIEVDNLEISGMTKVTVPGYDRAITFGQMTNIAYRVANSDDEIIVSTTRPETLLGDVAVAVHPNDGRYSKYRGHKLWHPFRKCEIPIVFDDSVDPDFGSGAVKITPAHDKNDFAIAKRHALPLDVPVFDNKGLVLEVFDDFKGLPRFDARDKILHVLSDMNLVRDIRPHSMILPICSRSRDVIEYLLRDQWFVNCQEMSKQAMAYVRSGEIKIHPESKVKEYERWLGDCRDWCISRQLWWGHQIPAYEVDFGDEKRWIAAKSQADLDDKIRSSGRNAVSVTRDADVLDTWFSSALLPFSAFAWPVNSLEANSHFPLSLMETGHDILFFWVARMIMLSHELTGKLPFKEILLHGIICDSYGRKMSKSLGNVIVPDQVVHGASLETLLQVTRKNYATGVLSKTEFEKAMSAQEKTFPNGIPECGVDAMRFTLCSPNIQNHFINFDVTECQTNKLFFNKIWQATKYLLKSYERHGTQNLSNCDTLPKMDQWILSRLVHTIQSAETAINEYNLHLATGALKNFFYYNFCDIYLESTKPAINAASSSEKARIHCETLSICLLHGLQLMSHFTPFLANALLPHISAIQKTKIEIYKNLKLETEISKILEISASIRQLKSQHTITRKMSPTVLISPENAEIGELIKEHQSVMQTLTASPQLNILDSIQDFDKHSFYAQSTAGHYCAVGVVVEAATTSAQSNVNLKKLAKLQQELEKLLDTVGSAGYQKSAVEKVKQKHSDKIKSLQIEIARIQQIQAVNNNKS